jgi:isopentenyldiphosphate isomerase
MSSTGVQQNDPTELLEVFDAQGNPTGAPKTRSAIHLDGDWHQAFHCWIVRAGPEIVLQRRSLTKDTFAGFWDAAAAGHWRFGESAPEAAREIAEELGLDVPFARLRHVARERLARRFANGLIDREFHQVYVLEWNAPLTTYRPDPSEVMAVAAFSARALVSKERIKATDAIRVASDGTVSKIEVEIRRDEMVPYSSARLRRLLKSARHG